ncbi:OPA family sugar phosphate sensor protein UhpC-like MFS transporter [Caulobacter ginsengisoli]|uniref:OPA family sugar phosphate sensor protein UhpC-like MFS transporter n=1 Tax=Caulobacter ginsengisoli TaxID=400775 RepID=A0ABU0IQF9_9CAUL|nr:MFS transporter [Caulobacter ginsengisoli]MDQ0463408.1 OPA family sugar phosphate sensor protein UhpC-like MFS transporter [Caulobacter ginsengisoli]
MKLLAAFAPSADAPPLSDPQEIDRRFNAARLRIIIAVTLGYGLLYTCRVGLGVVKGPLIDAGIFTPIQLGLIGAATYYGYAGGKLFNGFLADHVNPRALLVAGILLSALCNLAMSATTVVWIAAIIWGVNGWFQSFGAPACVISMAQWFSGEERGRYYGIWTISHTLGEGLTFLVTGTLVGALGWRAGFIGPGLLCLLVAAWTWWMMRERPQVLGLPSVARWRGVPEPPPPPETPALRLRGQLAILAFPEVWVLAVASALLYVSRYAITSWGVLYLQKAHHFDPGPAAAILSISTFAGAAGTVAFGFLSDLVFKARRPPVNLLFGVIELTGLLIFFYGPDNIWVLSLGMVLFGFGMTGLVTSVGGLFATDICPKHAMGAALGMIGVFSYVGTAIQENVSGWLIQSHMVGKGVAAVYDFQPAVLFWVACSAASLVLAATLWRARPRD